MPQTVNVRLMETYDLSTNQNRLGLIGIKTPSASYIQKKYSGLYKSFKFVRIKSCDVELVCASQLPADPLQIGQSAGKVAPQDMFNPLLYTACSNDTWNALLSRIYNSATSQYVTNSLSQSVRVFNDALDGADDTTNWNVYYGLLAEGKMKKAFVQSGLSMRGLVPIVYQVLATNGLNAGLSGDTQPTVDSLNEVVPSSNIGGVITGNAASPLNGNTVFKGHRMSMPRVPTYLVPTLLGGIPSCYVSAIVVPPASLNLTYFRLSVHWNVEFSGLRSDADWSLTDMASIGNWSRSEFYASEPTATSKYSETAVNADEGDVKRSVDADGVNLDLVMEA